MLHLSKNSVPYALSPPSKRLWWFGARWLQTLPLDPCRHAVGPGFNAQRSCLASSHSLNLVPRVQEGLVWCQGQQWPASRT